MSTQSSARNSDSDPSVVETALSASYIRHAAAEQAAWEDLRRHREDLVALLSPSIGESAVRRMLCQVEGKRRIESGDEAAVQVLTRISAAADQADAQGPVLFGRWLAASREFSDASDRAFRAATELSDFLGPEARQRAEGMTAMGDLKREILSIAARVNPTVDIRFTRELYGEGPGLVASGAASEERIPVAGMYQPFYHMASVSLDRRFNPLDTTFHEGFHSIESVLTPAERATLRHAFPPEGGMSSEERVATAFADWALRRKRIEDMAPDATPEVRRSFRRMGLFSGRTRQALLGHGMEKAEQIFDKVYGGEMGRRMSERPVRRSAGARDSASLGSASYSVGSPPGAREDIGAGALDAVLRDSLDGTGLQEQGGWRFARIAPGVVAADRIDAGAARQAFVEEWRGKAGLLMPQELGSGRIHVADELYYASGKEAPFQRMGGVTIPHRSGNGLARHHVYVERLQPDPASVLAHESFHTHLREGRLTDAEFAHFRNPANLDIGIERYQLDRYPGHRRAEEFGAHYVGERHARLVGLSGPAGRIAGDPGAGEHVFASGPGFPPHTDDLLKPVADGILSGQVGRRPPNAFVRDAWIDAAGWGRLAPLGPPPRTHYSLGRQTAAWGMYTPEGDRRVSDLAASIETMKDAGVRRQSRAEAVRRGIDVIGADHPEINDTAVIEAVAEAAGLTRAEIQPAWRDALAARGGKDMVENSAPDLRTPEGRAQVAIARNSERWHGAMDLLREDLREAGVFTARALQDSEPWSLRIAKDHTFDTYLGEARLEADGEGIIRATVRAYDHPADRGERPQLISELPSSGPLARASQACEGIAVMPAGEKSSVSDTLTPYLDGATMALSAANLGAMAASASRGEEKLGSMPSYDVSIGSSLADSVFSVGKASPDLRTPEGRAQVAIARNSERWHGAMDRLREEMREAGVFIARALPDSPPWTLRIARDHTFDTYLGEVGLAADANGVIRPEVRAYSQMAGRGERPSFAEDLPSFGPLARAALASEGIAVERSAEQQPDRVEPPYTLHLASCGNPDHGGNPERPLPGLDDRDVAVSTLGEASLVARAWIEANNLGGGNWAGGQVREMATGEVVARVSFNGRVWEGAEWSKDHVEITEADPRYSGGRDDEAFAAARRRLPPASQFSLDGLPSRSADLLTAVWTAAQAHVGAMEAGSAAPSAETRVLLEQAVTGSAASPLADAAKRYLRAMEGGDEAAGKEALAAMIGAPTADQKILSERLAAFIPSQAAALAPKSVDEAAKDVPARSPGAPELQSGDAGTRILGKLALGGAKTDPIGVAVDHASQGVPAAASKLDQGKADQAPAQQPRSRPKSRRGAEM